MIHNGAKIGRGVTIDGEVTVYPGVEVGDASMLQDGCYLPPGVTVGKRVFIGPRAVFTNDRHPTANKPGFEPMPTVVGDDVVIGANATILCGLTIGAGALIGAGAVVVSSVEAGAIVVGNPARTIVR